jgi:hypothetical protein
MKLAIAAALVAPVAAFNMEMTFSVGKKKAPKKAAPVKKSVGGEWGPSVALPFDKSPPTLDGTLVGDVGFDPVGFTTIGVTDYFNSIVKTGYTDDLLWYREAELMHGRIAQLAVVGFIAPGLFGTLPGNEWSGVDAYSYTNPLEAWDKAPSIAILQIVLFASYLETKRIKILADEGDSHMPGDFKWGQGEGRYNPFNFDYTPEEYEEKQLQELKHCRLAMIASYGLFAQALASGKGVVDQLGAALTVPEYAAKAGYFLPEGI